MSKMLLLETMMTLDTSERKHLLEELIVIVGSQIMDYPMLER